MLVFILDFLCSISSLSVAVISFTKGQIDLALTLLLCTIIWNSGFFINNEELIKKVVMKKPSLILISSVLPLCIAGAISLFAMENNKGWLLLLGSIFWAMYIVNAGNNKQIKL